jgi:hypothetical protein
MWNLVTLDGFFEGENNWDLAFHELVWGKELEQISTEQLRSADMLVFGKVTYHRVWLSIGPKKKARYPTL